MAGSKALIGVLLAAAVLALLATAARAVDDEHMYHWKCFKSCTGTCSHEDAVVAMDGSNNASSSVVPGGGGKCKNRCLNECFEDLPAVCYHQCVVTNCLHLPPWSKDKMTCLKSCCTKCFHHGPPPAPGPGPKPPKPPAPGPGPKPPKPPTPGPGPKPKPPPTPCPPKPKPPSPKPPPGPKPPSPPKPKPPTKPKPPKPPTPPKAPPAPKKPCPCPPGTEEASNN